MKKLLLIGISLILFLNIQAQISITKIGDAIRFSGVTNANTTLMTTTPGTVFLTGIDLVLVQGGTIRIGKTSDKNSIISLKFSQISDSLGATTPLGYVSKLDSLGYFTNSIKIDDGTGTIVNKFTSDPVTLKDGTDEGIEATVAERGLTTSLNTTIIDGTGSVITTWDTDSIHKRVNVVLKDGSSSRQATIATRGSTTALNTTIIDGNGAVVSSFGGADVDKTAFAVGTDKGTVIEGIYSVDPVTTGQKAAVSITADRALRTYETSTMNYSSITHTSPVNGSCVFTTDSTLTAASFPFTVDRSTCFIASVTIERVDGTVLKYENARNGISITSSSNVIRIKGVKPFLVSDLVYRVAISTQPQSISSTTGRQLTDIQNPDYYQHLTNVEFNNTNQPQGLNYYPTTSGGTMDNYKNLTITGKIIQGDAVNDSIYFQVTNDETLTDWVSISGYDWKSNTTISQYKQTGAGTITFAWQFTNLNFKYWRVVAGLGDATNTVVIRSRKSY
jgi:hypothetical protein